MAPSATMRTSAMSPMMMSRRRVNQPRFSATMPPSIRSGRSGRQPREAGPAGAVYAAARVWGVRSDTRDGHLADQDGRSADRAEETEITPDRGNRLQHVGDRARDRHLPEWLTELATGDTESRRAHGELSGDGTRARMHAQDLLNEHATLGAREEVGGIEISSWHVEVRGADPGNAGVAGPLRVPRRPRVPPPRRVRVVEEPSERSALDQRRPLCRNPLIVERRGFRPDLEPAVVDQREQLRADLLAHELREQRAALLHGLGRKRPGQHAE